MGAVYPISLRRYTTRSGKDRQREKIARKNQLAARIENYLNSKVEENAKEIQIFDYWRIAADLDIPLSDVEELCFCINGGHNGCTIRNPNVNS